MISPAMSGLLIKIMLMAFIGFLMRKRGLMDDVFSKNIADLLLMVVIPINMLAVGNSRYDARMAANLGTAALIVGLYYLLAFGLMWLLSRALPLKGRLKGLFVNLMVLGNVGYIGFPIVAELLGAEGSLYTVVYNLGFQLVTFTVGMFLMGDRDLSFKKFITSPMTLSPIIAIAIFVSPLRLPAPVVSTFELIAGMSAPISMFIIGGALAKIKFTTLFTSLYSWLVFLLRQLAIPLAMAGIFVALGLSGVLPATMVVLTGMPSGTINVIFSERYGVDPPFATRTVVLCTGLMVVSLPLLMALAERLFL